MRRVTTFVVLVAPALLWLGMHLLFGEVAGLAWHPSGAGSSVAVCGLLGALAIVLWRRVQTLGARVGASILIAMGAALTLSADLHGPPILAGAIVALVLHRSAGRRGERA
jgi:rhomboid protease GluP